MRGILVPGSPSGHGGDGLSAWRRDLSDVVNVMDLESKEFASRAAGAGSKIGARCRAISEAENF